MKRLVRQGVLVQEQDEWYEADGIAEDTDSNALRPLQQGSIVGDSSFKSPVLLDCTTYYLRDCIGKTAMQSQMYP